MAVTTIIPTNLSFPHRGQLERDAFVNAQETAQDLLAGGFTSAVNQYATELNATEANINAKAEEVANQAVDGGYSQAYINANFINKDINSLTDKPTPIDADLIPLSDSASSFSLKKLSFANIKATILNALNGLTAKITPVDADILLVGDSASSFSGKKLTFANLKAMIFTNSSLTGIPTAPTQTAGDNSTKIATTAYVDGKMVRGTVVNSTSGTSIDFTGIPSWAKRVTIMMKDISLSGTSALLVQIGNTTIQATGYNSSSGGAINAATPAVIGSTAGFIIYNDTSTDALTAVMKITNITSNSYVAEYTRGGTTGRTVFGCGAGSVTLTGLLDRVRITTLNGTDTFDAGQINIIYEG